ncbi:MAG: hypothetical protein QOJ94_15 [Sphingomonadales bacterium]|jgi:hypothetical protein|nr:hypothetical protein [Sphingomonadales bacterium]
MHAGNDAILLVRADLSERLESLRAQSRRASERDFTDAVETIRRIAAAYGLVPVARIAEALGHAAADGPACPRALYLSRLQDAIGCERMDEAASEAMLASVSVRLCG